MLTNMSFVMSNNTNLFDLSIKTVSDVKIESLFGQIALRSGGRLSRELNLSALALTGKLTLPKPQSRSHVMTCL